MPGTGAKPEHAYSFGPGWAAYRLPFPGAHGFISGREAGVASDGEPAPGANPPAGGGDPPPAPPAPPATGDQGDKGDGLGDPGKRALDQERQARRDADDRAKTLQKELDDLKAASQTDQEKALDEARKQAKAEVRTEYEARIRKSEARSALRAAGMTNDKALDLYANAPEFASLKVSDDGAVEGLDKVVEALKKDVPESFAPAKPAPTPPVNRGANPNGNPDQPKTLEDAITAGLSAQKT